jgi:hypothetical protein
MTLPIMMLEQSLAKNELHRLLMGEGQYYYPDQFIEAPTDLATLFFSAFNNYASISKTNAENLTLKIKEAMIQLLDHPDGTWWSLSIMYSYLYGYKPDSLKFKIEIEELVPTINESLKKFSDNLKTNKTWVGCRFANSLWDDINNIVPKINTMLTNGRKIEL